MVRCAIESAHRAPPPPDLQGVRKTVEFDMPGFEELALEVAKANGFTELSTKLNYLEFALAAAN